MDILCDGRKQWAEAVYGGTHNHVEKAQIVNADVQQCASAQFGFELALAAHTLCDKTIVTAFTVRANLAAMVPAARIPHFIKYSLS